jgi:hypothetical protein
MLEGYMVSIQVIFPTDFTVDKTYIPEQTCRDRWRQNLECVNKLVYPKTTKYLWEIKRNMQSVVFWVVTLHMVGGYEPSAGTCASTFHEGSRLFILNVCNNK